MQVKIGPQLEEILLIAYQASQPTMLSGPHGVGKSESLKSCARRMSIGSVVFDLSIMEPTDLVGILQVIDGRTTFCPPVSLPNEPASWGQFIHVSVPKTVKTVPKFQILAPLCGSGEKKNVADKL